MKDILDAPNQDDTFTNLPGKLAGLKYKIALAEENIQRAKYFLFVLAAFAFLQLILFLVNYGTAELYEGHIIYGTLFLIYLCCAAIGWQKPMIGIGAALIAYTLFHIALFFLYEVDLLDNYVAKGVSYFFLITGFFYCFKANKMTKNLKDQLNQLNFS